MREYLLITYEFLVSFVPFLIIFLILSQIYKQKSIPVPKSRNIFLFLFAIYLIAVFYLTGFGTLWDGMLYNWEIRNINLLPFSRAIDWAAYFQNILLFLPFGFLCPLLWKNMDNAAVMGAAGFSFSILIEISQLLNNRASDVDDLIMNTLGTLIGYIFYRIFSHFYPSKRSQSVKYEPLMYIAVISLGRFFLYNEFFLVKLLYRF